MMAMEVLLLHTYDAQGRVHAHEQHPDMLLYALGE
jgi:hypothetical protein